MTSTTGRLWVGTWRSPIRHYKRSRWTIIVWMTVRWKCCTSGFAVGRPTNRLYSLHWGRWSNNSGKLNAVLYIGLLDYMWFIHCSSFFLQQPWTHQIIYQRLLCAMLHSQLLVIWQLLNLYIYYTCTWSMFYCYDSVCMYVCIYIYMYAHNFSPLW